MDEARSKIIEDNPIGKGLDGFRTSFKATCENNGISSSPDATDHLDQEDVQKLSVSLLSALQNLDASRQLPPRGRGKNLFANLLELAAHVNSDDFDSDRIISLFKVAVDDSSADMLIWLRVYDAVTEPTPPPQPLASSVSQTPWLYNTSGFANSSEYRQDVDRVLKQELGALYVGVQNFHEQFFGGIPGLKSASEAVLEKCTEGDSPLIKEKRWVGWPEDANQDRVLSWFAETIDRLATFAESHRSTPTERRRPLAQPNKPIQGSTAERKMDVGLVNDPDARTDSLCHWKQILVPGELKSNPSADVTSKAWLDLGRYAREVLAAQDGRRYVLGFTLCGTFMRIWEFDRLGGIASKKFDIHDEALQFVATIIGFLWMSNEDLGFDPTICTLDGQRYIKITRNGQTESLIIDKVIRHAPCVAGRATTCWRAYREGHPQTPFVIKDSWQYTERMQEGELLRETTKKGVVNVARYYHHETVQVFGRDDDVLGNVRKGLDITMAEDHRSGRSSSPSAANTPQKGRSSAGVKRSSGRTSAALPAPKSSTGVKRSSSQTGAALPAPKRHTSSRSRIKSSSNACSNRIRRRVVISDYGKPIYDASSRVVLLRAFAGCIKGHQSLRCKAETLHRDISVNNMMINEDSDNPSWSEFLIDLDLSIKESRTQASGAKGKTGTRAFMAIGVLQGEQHSFMHDLESFFWVLFWICIHYDGPGKGKVVPRFDRWNYADMEDLANLKLGMVSDEAAFRRSVTGYFTEYYKPLIPWVIKLKRVVFPHGKKWKTADEDLYTSMMDILHTAQQDQHII